MNLSFWKKLILEKAGFLSPKDLLQRAFFLCVLYFLAHLAGLREYTSVLNGTVGSVALGWNLSAFLAAIYIMLYLAFVILVPVMILAAVLLLIWQRLRKKPQITDPNIITGSINGGHPAPK